MPVYHAPLQVTKFLLHDLLDISSLSRLPGYEDVSNELIDQILDEGAKLCEDALFPLNQSGDEEGCHFNDGEVTTPKGFIEAYRTFAEGGWTGLAADPDYGGMGMPNALNIAMQEMISAANMSLGMYPGLSQGAYDAIYQHGTDEQKALYLPKLTSGEWSGTMNLTEPQCGTDLGLITTKAEPSENDSYAITGTKIFISAGEHDLTENIIHLVLARLPDAPEGMKGISLFLVPKFLPNEDGSVGERNNVWCGSIEHKMGITANATCVMNYDKATGWLVGEPHAGLRAMFTMMNAARLAVGMQGLGCAEIAYQNAQDYARERLQMRALPAAKYPDKPADPIIVHPDVRRMLLTMKAFTIGARALALLAGKHLDIAEKSENHEEAEAAEDLVALLTPILKAYQTDMGFECANLAIQIYGGHGYIREYGVEQYARDARIAQIYEGTNGIQALDLVGRKMSKSFGRYLRQFFHPVQAFIEEHQADEDLQIYIFGLAKAFAKLQQSTGFIAQKGLKDMNEGAAAATDYLRQFALVAVAYMWVQIVIKAKAKIEAEEGDKDFHQSLIHTADFYFAKMLPEADWRFKAILAGAEPIMTPEEQAI